LNNKSAIWKSDLSVYDLKVIICQLFAFYSPDTLRLPPLSLFAIKFLFLYKVIEKLSGVKAMISKSLLTSQG